MTKIHFDISGSPLITTRDIFHTVSQFEDVLIEVQLNDVSIYDNFMLTAYYSQPDEVLEEYPSVSTDSFEATLHKIHMIPDTEIPGRFYINLSYLFKDLKITDGKVFICFKLTPYIAGVSQGTIHQTLNSNCIIKYADTGLDDKDDLKNLFKEVYFERI